MRLRTAIPDIVQGLVACLAGGLVFFVFHDLWYRQWMGLLGDPPMSNPAYDVLRAIFVSLSYATGAAVIGLLAGFGYARPWWRAVVRLLAGPVLSLLVLARRYEDPALARLYLPVLFGCFALSLLVSAAYHRLARQGESSPDAQG